MEGLRSLDASGDLGSTSYKSIAINHERRGESGSEWIAGMNRSGRK
jgi:hypothetical protein